MDDGKKRGKKLRSKIVSRGQANETIRRFVWRLAWWKKRFVLAPLNSCWIIDVASRRGRERFIGAEFQRNSYFFGRCQRRPRSMALNIVVENGVQVSVVIKVGALDVE